jgi:hypothetical protein
VVPSLTVIVLEFDLIIFNPMQILFINIIKHVCQGRRSKETTDGLLKKMGGTKPAKPVLSRFALVEWKHMIV